MIPDATLEKVSYKLGCQNVFQVPFRCQPTGSSLQTMVLKCVISELCSLEIWWQKVSQMHFHKMFLKTVMILLTNYEGDICSIQNPQRIFFKNYGFKMVPDAPPEKVSDNVSGGHRSFLSQPNYGKLGGINGLIFRNIQL
ncbi:hypothetical protein CEXT_350711 [Caerostris extrusa]|uniref:Uncharacterized protein n=1 Tax=Caerostris extrusa TaxID=172846 RepID=A0AAV4VXB7_CAEEX|nr:hypothetical protein CEXT_350711 [Caerostris extrusa]